MTIRSTSANREDILGRIRTSVGASADAAARRVKVQKRLYDHETSIIPERSKQPHDALVDQFEAILKGQSATVLRIGRARDAAGPIADYLRDNNLPARVRHGSDPRLKSVDWSQAAHIERDNGRAAPQDTTSLSYAFAGASETGTAILVSGQDNPTTLNFLPENHIVMIDAHDIAGPYEAAWSRLRETYGERTMPRTVNMISGPSRTADIEQTLIMGAHGPRRLLVLIVTES